MELAGYRVVDEVIRMEPYVFFRAVRAEDARPVLVKTPAIPTTRGPEVEALARELGLLRELPPRGLPAPLELVRNGTTAALVLEDRGLSPVRSRMGAGGLDIVAFLEVARRLCETLGALHQRDLILGGLSPSTVWVGPDFQDLQLVDLSQARRSVTDARGPIAVRASAAAYMSPEQTGRTSRRLDHRSDFYSLGAILYELVTGHPPFESADCLELVHAHIARTAVAPAADPRVPEQLSRLVMRLLAKPAEDRYQTARGIVVDLERCAREWRDGGRIDLFDLAGRDLSDRLLIPQRLYGRDRELRAAARLLDDACQGGTRLLLVSGHPGVGKTAFIGELYGPIVRQRGRFVSGKVDPVARHVPYGCVLQAFRALMRQLLAENEESLAAWRARMTEALGSNGAVLAEVMPEVEFILGRQRAPAPLDPAEASNRFRFAFQSLVGALAGPDHPLVVFLDDLHWADPATLDLLHALLTGPDIHHLLIVGAYRDSEVTAALRAAVARLQAAGRPATEMPLGPLTSADLDLFLADTLRTDRAAIAPLGRLVLQKTGGNPFFVIQFLKTLHEERLIAFDHEREHWAVNTEAIRTVAVTDNVVELMAEKIRRLSPRARQVARLAACIGSSFRWNRLLTASRLSANEARAGLAEALETGLVEAAGTPGALGGDADEAETYRFLHDRVHQAAYGLIPEEQRAAIHLDVGRLLLAECGGDVPDDRLFEIVNHLRVGSPLVTDGDERRRVARLHLAAARRARASGAFGAASDYLEGGLALADDDWWRDAYGLMFALALEAAEGDYLVGRFDRAERRLDAVAGRAATRSDRAQVCGHRIVLYEKQSRYGAAVEAAREGLALFDLTLPVSADATGAPLDADIDAIDRLVGDRTIASLVDLPAMLDADTRQIMSLLTAMWPPAYLSGDLTLTRLVSATMVRMSLEHGNTEDSAYGYVTHAITVGPVRGEYRRAYEWGSLALQVNQRFDDARHRAKIHQQFHAHVQLWCEPFERCLPHARTARETGLEAGDFTYAGYGAVTETWHAMLVTPSLDEFVREYAPVQALLEKIQMPDFLAALKVNLGWALALQGQTAGPLSLTSEGFDEAAFAATYERAAPFFLTFLYAARVQLGVLHGEYDAALDAARRARAVSPTGTIWPVLIDFWGGLALAGTFPDVPEAERPARWAELAAARHALEDLARSCPDNFRVFWLLLSAEIERLAGRDEAMAQLLEQAEDDARRRGNPQWHALASEMRGRALLAREPDRAAGLLTEACRLYRAWGAAAKVRQMEQRYGRLLAGAPALEPGRPTDERDTAALDLSTVLKIARAIAVEIALPDLLRTLMKIAMENAGAERGLFLRDEDGTVAVEAEARAGGEDVRIGPPAPAAGNDDPGYSPSVVRYVRRTGQDLVVADGRTDDRFAADEHVRRAGVRSILCVPVSHQGRSGGVLYLENNLATDAFTPERIAIMRIVVAQAAISLENARLYETMRAEIDRRTSAERALREALGELERLKNRLEAENVYLQEEIRTQHNFNEIVGNSPALVEALARVERVAPTESTVLFVGETGSGKELFARAVHSRSRRRDRPLVKVNCGAIAPGLVESELFGHVKGAFTGAIDKRTGRFELANGGTIFLDEVGELPLDAQVKLLRVLQEREFEPVGSSRTIRVDVRVVAATNRNLEQAVRDGTFRADLLYRLNVFPIIVPALRDRDADVPLLVAFFVEGLARKLGKPIHGFSTRSMERLRRYAWPGNVRELQNVVERAAILSQDGVLEVEAGFGDDAPPPPARPPRDDAPGAGRLDQVQRQHILDVLRTTGGVVGGAKGAAAILGLHPNTLRSRMKKLGIVTPAVG